jgi:hypothetical protein
MTPSTDTRVSGGCSCHGATFCPDLIWVGYEDDVPVFVRRDSEEGKAAVTEEDRAKAAKRMRDAAPELYEALDALVRSYGTCGPMDECPICNSARAALTKARAASS